MQLCSCGSYLPFSMCCEPLLNGIKEAPTAEALMRSRFCAFVHGHDEYIIRTYIAKKRKKAAKDLHRASSNETWKRLEIVSILEGRQQHEQGQVEFKAFYQLNGKEYCLHERSFFIREANLWRYVGPVKA